MTALGREAIEALDSGSMLADVLHQPVQLTDALWRVEAAAIEPRDATGGLIVCGMGGSAIGGDLAVASIGSRATRPIDVVRGDAPPPWAGPDTLVLCASYSGETEETLACYRDAGAAGAARVAVTTGGSLAAAARADGVPVIGVPAGLAPRAAAAYVAVATLECAAACAAAPRLGAEVEAAASLLAALVAEWGPEAPDDSLAKALARGLHGAIPVIYGAGPTVAPARRWKTQLNENAGAPAFFGELPEVAHNEVCAFARARGLAPLRAVFLEDPDAPGRALRRLELTAAAAEGAGLGVDRVSARGASGVERVMSLVLLGDLVSVYVAALAGIDPTPVEAIERLKRELG